MDHGPGRSTPAAPPPGRGLNGLCVALPQEIAEATADEASKKLQDLANEQGAGTRTPPPPQADLEAFGVTPGARRGSSAPRVPHISGLCLTWFTVWVRVPQLKPCLF